MHIGHRAVGPAHVPLVIAEIGINHGGRLDVARSMVDAAARAGVEIVKHQTHVVDDEMSAAARQVIPGNADISIYDIMAGSALSEDDEIALRDYVQAKGMIFISTPFSRAAADRLARMDVPAFKIGSGECNNYPLLRHVASFGKPVILSTGMNTIESVAQGGGDLRRGAGPGRAPAHDQPVSDAAASGAARRDDASWPRRFPTRSTACPTTRPTTWPASPPSRLARRLSSATSPITCVAKDRTSCARWTSSAAAS